MKQFIRLSIAYSKILAKEDDNSERRRNIEREVIQIIQESFTKLKIEISKKVVKYIDDKNEQQLKIKYYHEGKTSHRGCVICV